MTTRVLTNKTRLSRTVSQAVQPAFKWLGHALYSASQPALDEDSNAPWWADSLGNIKVALSLVGYATPSSYVVSGSWPTPADAAYLRVTSAPGTALAARVGTVWIVRNETASGLTVAGVSVATKTIVWISTDSAGSTTSLAMGSVP